MIGSPRNRKGIVTATLPIDLVVVSSTDIDDDDDDDDIGIVVMVVVASLLSPRFNSSSLKVFWYFCSVLTLKSIGFFLGSMVVLKSCSLLGYSDLRSIVSFLASPCSGSTAGISSITASENSTNVRDQF